MSDNQQQILNPHRDAHDMPNNDNVHTRQKNTYLNISIIFRPLYLADNRTIEASH